ncbi:MAG: ATP-grasp domain-containing protein [Gammaproteobacteria bacterium]|nr:ATP-grasp domain-containing protein [Gammaproteobacteria bacterium]
MCQAKKGSSGLESRKIDVLIPDGESVFSLAVLHGLSQADEKFRVHLISQNRCSPVRFSRYIESFTLCPEEDEARLHCILRAIRERGIDILLPVHELGLKFVVKHKTRLESLVRIPPIADADSFALVSDKGRLAHFLEAHNLASPCTLRYIPPHDVPDLTALQFPALIKPAEGANGRGIKRFETASSLLEYFEAEAVDEDYIIQNYIDGYDIDCSVLCSDGEILAYTIQKGLAVGCGDYQAPTEIEFLHDQAVYDLVSRMLRKLSWSGVAHIDLRYDAVSGKINIIEINPRYWGSLPGSLIAGVNFPHLACLATQNISFLAPDYHHVKYAAAKAALRLIRDKIFKGVKTDIRIGDTDLPNVLKDPLPEIVRLFFRC